MAYTPNPTDPTRPTAADFAGNMYLEFQALKGYIQSLLPNAGGLGVQGAFRNRLNNGAMNIFQRGSSVSVGIGATAYTLDQWIGVNQASTLLSVNQVAGDGPNGNNKVLAMTQSGGGTGQVSLVQHIEANNALDLVAGTQVTVSGWYKTTGPLTGTPVSVLLYSAGALDNFGTLNVAAAAQPIGYTSITSNGYTYFKNTITLTRDCTLGLALYFVIPGGITGAPIYFTQLQLERGGFASNFEVRPVALDLQCCQRYFQAGQVYAAGYAAAAGNNLQSMLGFPGSMKSAPTIVLTGVTATNCTPTVSTFTNVAGFLISLVAGAAGMATYSAQYTASAEI